LRLSIVVLLAVLIVGSIVISLGFITNQETLEIPEISNQYESLEKYKIELEKINQDYQEVLEDLQNQIENSDNEHLEQIKEEIKVINQVINDNKVELEQVIQKLSEIESKP
jgi:predicted PurR-regulated permease PerM